jgi:hypothetical protein
MSSRVDLPDLPVRLRVVGATDLEQQLLEAAASEQPSPDLSRRMAQAIGVSLVGGAVASATVAGKGVVTVAGPGAISAKLAGGTLWPWICAGLLAFGVAGGFVATRAKTAPALAPAARPAWPAGEGAPAAPAAPADLLPAIAVEPRPTETAPSPRRSPVTTASGLRAQIAMIDAARSALADGSSEHALEILRRYQDKYPAGGFRPEAAALTVEALARLGRIAEARSLAGRFLAEHGGGPLADRVARAAGLPRP